MCRLRGWVVRSGIADAHLFENVTTHWGGIYEDTTWGLRVLRLVACVFPYVFLMPGELLNEDNIKEAKEGRKKSFPFQLLTSNKAIALQTICSP